MPTLLLLIQTKFTPSPHLPNSPSPHLPISPSPQRLPEKKCKPPLTPPHRGRFFTKGRVRTFIVKIQSTSGGNIVKIQSASGGNHGSSIKTMMINNDKLSTLSAMQSASGGNPLFRSCIAFLSPTPGHPTPHTPYLRSK
ncbi:MAG: hypothetical protein F6K65_25565 [Moorea sp. SIO3C2]|nr:hypothetical protein [Moorena sp. SIO3C2]